MTTTYLQPKSVTVAPLVEPTQEFRHELNEAAGWPRFAPPVEVDFVNTGSTPQPGANLTIFHSMSETPLGPALIAASERALACLGFPRDEGERLAELNRLERAFPAARLVASKERASSWAGRIFGLASISNGNKMPLLAAGTSFQILVWRALMKVPPGETTTYGELAQAIARPGAARAVGTAVGANRICLLIPCHRVLPANGGLGGFRWGVAQKKWFLQHEKRFSSAALARSTSPLLHG
jgi:AraC family transcriptional regulator of adaptative response/methylated-DNA-[protein]-cysteine methyltransferase